MPSVKLTVTIPEKLAERLEPYRGRLNLSQITAEAIERKVKELEDIAGPAEAVADLIIRLREQADAERDAAYQAAFEDALQYALGANLSEFRQWETWRALPDPAALFHMLPASSLTKLDELQAGVESTERWDVVRQFVKGWLDGTSQVWEGVKIQLQGGRRAEKSIP